MWGRKSDFTGLQRVSIRRKWRKLVEATPLKSMDEAEKKWDSGNQEVLTDFDFYTDIIHDAGHSML